MYLVPMPFAHQHYPHVQPSTQSGNGGGRLTDIAAVVMTLTVLRYPLKPRYGGYQDESGYKQQKATLRLDHEWQDWWAGP